MSNNKTFHLAITMAGAISAGAYTAGVMDYLLEVLDKWETMKNDENLKHLVPKHNVVIDVLSGASAGGMTACIASLAVQRKLHPIAAYSPEETKGYDNLPSAELTNRKKDNRLYNSWVNLTADDMIPTLLKTDDITSVSKISEKTFISGLNSKFIKEIAGKNLVLKNPTESLEFPPFISRDLRTFVTLTNLDGFKKETKFAQRYASGFFTYDHRDIAMFSFNHQTTNPFDGSIDVNFQNQTNTDLFIKAGMATGAFPIGLAYRTFSRNRAYIEDNILLRHLNGGNKIRLHSNDVLAGNQYKGTFIDGGTIDNEPFDLTKFLLKTQVEKVEPKFLSSSFKTFNSTILMIDPFPSEEMTRIQIEEDKSPFSVIGAIGKLFSTVRTQSQLKTEDIKNAMDTNNCSCYMLSPRRRLEGKNPIDGSLAIACGSLGGFGGFLDKDFRKHDFFLGRINCKSFLQKHFVISDKHAQHNPIFKESYENTHQNQEIRKMFQNELRDSEGNTKEVVFPIIPDVNLIGDKERGMVTGDLYYGLKFPKYTEKEFRKRFLTYKTGIKHRLKMIVQSNIKDYSPTALYIGVGLLFGGNKAFEKIYEYVRDELTRWEIIK